MRTDKEVEETSRKLPEWEHFTVDPEYPQLVCGLVKCDIKILPETFKLGVFCSKSSHGFSFPKGKSKSLHGPTGPVKFAGPNPPCISDFIYSCSLPLPCFMSPFSLMPI